MRFSRYSAQGKLIALYAYIHKRIRFFLYSEPARDRNSGCCEVRCTHFDYKTDSNGDEGIRTHDPLLARQVLSQLSYTPTVYRCL